MRILKLAVSGIATSMLSGCFFVFIPGALINKASDAITGAEGENCVASWAKVGDSIKMVDGRQAVVRSLSGTSTRCTQPEFPIRAKLEFL